MDGPHLADSRVRARPTGGLWRPARPPRLRAPVSCFSDVSDARDADAGFSILEILVALTIGAVILLALGDVLVSSKVNYLREENVARIQESGRFATLALGEQIRPARSLDCFLVGAGEQLPSFSVKACQLLTGDCATASPADRQYKHVLTIDQPLGYDASERGNVATWLSGLPAAARTNVAGRWLRGDVLVTWGLAGTGSPVANELPWPGDPTTPATITLDNPITISRNTAAVITDCQSTDVFTVTNLSANRKTLTQAVAASDGERVNADPTFSAAYNTPPDPQSAGKTYRAQVYPLRYSVFYVCCTDSRSGALQSGGGVNQCMTNPDRYRPALCVWDLGGRNTKPGTSQALIPDVADLRVTWGSIPGLTNGFSPDDTTKITTAAWVSANKRWPDVSTARVELLIAGTDTNRRVKATAVAPANPAWPPNPVGAESVHEDTVGASIAADTRLYQRFVIHLAVRSRTPWYLVNRPQRP